MKNPTTLAFALVLLSLTSGCARSQERSGVRHDATAVAAPSPAAASGPTDSIATGGTVREAQRALIVTGELYVSTKNVGAAIERIRADVERAGGYVSDAQESGGKEQRQATLELRIPADKTRSLRAMLADFGEITSDVEKVEDVTEARADLEARLRNARLEEQRIEELMRERTAALADVLAAERELARVREQVERLEAQQRSMNGKIALATIKVHLNGPAPTTEVEAWRTPGKSIASAFRHGLEGAAALAVYSAMALAGASPILVPLGTVLAVVFVLARRKRRALAA